MTQPLTSALADWILNLRPSDISDSAKHHAIEHILDGYGVGMSGVAADGYEILYDEIRGLEGPPDVHIFGTAHRAPARHAALINGAAMHAMDFDDQQIPLPEQTSHGSMVHPTSAALAGASAVAELTGASGEDMLVAFIAGLETQCHIANATLRRRGFHPTGTIGPFGSLAAAGRLLNLTHDQMLHAFGIAAPLGGGYVPNFGTMTKWLHVGQAAEAGIMAAQLARKGFTAGTNILEDPLGFCTMSGEGFEPEHVEWRLGTTFILDDPGVAIKPYPCGALLHPGMDAALELIIENDIHPEDVEEAIATTDPDMPLSLRYPRPTTEVEARFSFPFNLAILLLRRQATVAEYTDEIVQSESVQRMIQRCNHVGDPSFEDPNNRMKTRITFKMKDGRIYEKEALPAKGHPSNPLSRQQLEQKFVDCASLIISEEQARRAIELIWNIETLPRIEQLHQELIGPGPARSNA